MSDGCKIHSYVFAHLQPSRSTIPYHEAAVARLDDATRWGTRQSVTRICVWFSLTALCLHCSQTEQFCELSNEGRRLFRVRTNEMSKEARGFSLANKSSCKSFFATFNHSETVEPNSYETRKHSLQVNLLLLMVDWWCRNRSI